MRMGESLHEANGVTGRESMAYFRCSFQAERSKQACSSLSCCLVSNSRRSVGSACSPRLRTANAAQCHADTGTDTALAAKHTGCNDCASRKGVDDKCRQLGCDLNTKLSFGASAEVRLTFRNGSELRLHKRQVEVTLSRRQRATLWVTTQPNACV